MFVPDWLPPVAAGALPTATAVATSCSSIPTSPSLHPRPLRYAVLGAGFAGLSVTWHLLKNSSKDLKVRIDMYDEAGIGGGAAGVSGGLLHPYSPKAKLLWRGAECWKECLMLLGVAEAAVGESCRDLESLIVRRRGILRPAMSMKNANILTDNAQNCEASCRIETIDKNAAEKLIPHICLPFGKAFYMPQAMNVHPMRYLQALFVACENLVKDASTSNHGQKELYLHKKSVIKLLELEGNYDAVIICLGAQADMLPELSGRLPLRTCRGVIAHLQLPSDKREEYPDRAPSILSDAWLALHGTRNLYMGSTWEWKSRNSCPNVSEDEASKALEELLPKASAFYPGIKDWTFAGAKAGLRAMPPLTPHGSRPLLGCVNHLVGENCTSRYWLFGGLGSRGLLYHAALGNLISQAVLSRNELLIPSELTAWKNIVR